MTETARRPRVLMLTSTLPRWDGDSEPRFVLDLAKHLGEHFDIELLAPHTRGAARSETLEGIRITRFRYWIPRWQGLAYQGGIHSRLRENPLRLFQVPCYLFALWLHVVIRLRRQPRVDLVHAHWIVPQALVAILAVGAAGRRVPVICTSHGGDLFGLQGRAWVSIKKWVLQRSNVVTVVSKAMAYRVRELLPEGAGAVVIPMGTDLQQTFTPPERERKPPLSRLIFVGRLVEKKGLVYLLDAMQRIARTHPGATLEIVGGGPFRDGLEVYGAQLGLSRAVTFAGPIPHVRLPAHYRRADVAVFPFIEAAGGDQEGFGLVMVEAMGCGCAVIASALPAVCDVIGQERGILVSPGDPDELAAAITSVLDNSSTSMQMAKRGRAYALDNFDWVATRAKFRSIYSSLSE